MKKANKGKKEKFLLAYSGGLDTSVLIHWLKENYDADVVACCADLGQKDVEFTALKAKALATGACKFIGLDLKQEFVEQYCFPALQAGALYEGVYPMHTALGRPLIAEALVKVAQQEGCSTIVHGCTGKGNDQVRIELGVQTLDPDLKLMAPLRFWEMHSRQEEIDYAQKHHIPVTATAEKPFSIDENIWGVATCAGCLESLNAQMPEYALSWLKPMAKWPKAPEKIKIEFVKGVPVAINDEKMESLELVEFLNQAGARHGVGLLDMVENRVVGIKSREIYEAPGAVILHTAYKKLETLILDKESLHYKNKMSFDYANMVYGGLWFSPLRKALQAFVNEIASKITGTVEVQLYQGKATACAPSSEYSLYDFGLATYGKEGTYDQKWADGFISIYGLPYKTMGKIAKKAKTKEDVLVTAEALANELEASEIAEQEPVLFGPGL